MLSTKLGKWLNQPWPNRNQLEETQMAKAIPVNSKPAEEVEAADPRRPNPAPETTINKPKTVTKLPDGTVIEDY